MPPKILVVEDDAQLLESFSIGLGGRFQVVAASTGSEALRQVTLHQDIELAVVDFRLPDMLGTEVLSNIKKMKPSIPVIIITGYGNEDVAIKAFRGGARDYIKKPFGIAELVDRIDFLFAVSLCSVMRRTFACFDETNAIDQERGWPNNDDRIRKVIQYTDRNYMTALTLQRVVNVACMSRRHFSRIFKKVTGLSYRDFLNDLRITKAADMLQNTSNTITEIAYMVGYNDLTCFERIFKKIKGKTPMDYRAAE